jgi:ATPase subunit of ABC transporter with duplicated ATPase domains
MLTTANITMQFGAKPLFEDISVKFSNGNVYGLIGANGCGKSTFMKILSGDLEPTNGNVSYTPGERIGVLKQDQFAYEEYSVIDTVIMGNRELWTIKEEKDAIYAKAEMTEKDGIRAGLLEGEFAELDGYMAESRAEELLSGLEIPTDQHWGPMSAIAPGWKLRVLLAQALFSKPDMLLLDEPTNNLDINTIRWLETIITDMKETTIIIISHDRHFLNATCTHMADIDYSELRVYPGNYDEYMVAATAVQEKLQSENAKKKTQIAELQEFVSRFSANASKSKQATSRKKQLDKIQLSEVKPSSRISPYIRFDVEKELRKLVVELDGIGKSFDKKLFSNFDLRIDAGDRIAIIGPNGIGKTTLLRILEGNLAADKGEVTWTENAQVGYFAQDHSADFAMDENLFDWMSKWNPAGADQQTIRGALGKMLFRANDIEKMVNILSGGEQGRMLFGKLGLQQNNVLLMDEPTNHLDMESIEALNLALANYEGTLIFVSHDREFVSSLATKIIELTPTGVVNYSGSYENYLEQKK